MDRIVAQRDVARRVESLRVFLREDFARRTTGATDTYRSAISTQAVGVLGVQLTGVGTSLTATTLAAAGKFTGKISWDPSGAVPEGDLRSQRKGPRCRVARGRGTPDHAPSITPHLTAPR